MHLGTGLPHEDAVTSTSTGVIELEVVLVLGPRTNAIDVDDSPAYVDLRDTAVYASRRGIRRFANRARPRGVDKPAGLPVNRSPKFSFDAVPAYARHEQNKLYLVRE